MLNGWPNKSVLSDSIATRAQILGVDALHTKDVRQTHKLLVAHLAMVRKLPTFAHCKLVLIFECAVRFERIQQRHIPRKSHKFTCSHRSNLAFESQHLLHAVEAAGINNWVSLSEGQQGTLGWLTTNERKVRYTLRQKYERPFNHVNVARVVRNNMPHNSVLLAFV